MPLWLATACLTLAFTARAEPVGIDQTLADFRTFLPQAQGLVEDLNGRVERLDKLWDPETKLNATGNQLTFKSRLKLRMFMEPKVTDKILSLPAVIASLKEILKVDEQAATDYQEKLFAYRDAFRQFVDHNRDQIESSADLERWVLVNRYVLYSEVAAHNVQTFLTYIRFLESALPEMLQRLEILSRDLQDLHFQEPLTAILAQAAIAAPIWLVSLATVGGAGLGVYSLLSLPLWKGMGLAAGITGAVNLLFYLFYPLIADYSEDKAQRLATLRSDLLDDFNTRWLRAYQQMVKLKADFAQVPMCRQLLGG
jgi:hypothetical protein